MRPDLGIGALAPPGGNVRGGGSPGAWHTRAAWATMPGWLVMTARPRRRCCGPLCAFWTGAGPRGRSDGCKLSPLLLPRPPPGPGTGPPGAASGPWQSGRRCWLRAGGVGPWHGSADRGRGARELPAANGPDAQAWHTGPGSRRDGNTCGPPALAVLPAVRTCFPCRVDGHRRAVAPAPPAAADGARDRHGSPERRILRPAGGTPPVTAGPQRPPRQENTGKPRGTCL